MMKSKFGAEILYVPSEKMLYMFDCERNGAKIFVCYQKALADPKKKDHLNHIKCTSRVRLNSNGTCERFNIGHKDHPDHGGLVADKKIVSNVKEKCQFLVKNFPEDAFKLPNRQIFQRELIQ